ncbi:MAG: DUF4111 domain-containing protein [Spirochaetales bacterium]|nr:DUF4111 domain-containing protein [Spirochaetales bacterium]
MAITEEIKAVCDAFISALKDALSNKLYAAYIYGAAAFPDTLPTGDIDFHVILNDTLTEDESSAITRIHEGLQEKYPPLGGELDGYYILLVNAKGRTPPQSVMWTKATDFAWALHRKHILEGRVIRLYGPEPEEIYSEPTWDEIETALMSELEFASKNLLNYPDYCILNLSRLIYSFRTKDVVVSKDKASMWAIENLGEWKKYIKYARKSYMHKGTQEEKQSMLDNVKAFYDYALIEIRHEN